MFDPKHVVDLVTFARGLLALGLVWLGWSQGADRLGLAVYLILVDWTGDVLDGAVPIPRSRRLKEYLTPNEIQEISAYIRKHRSTDSYYDICMSGILPAINRAEDRAIVNTYKEAGAPWWIDFIYTGTGSLKANTTRIRFGPPRWSRPPTGSSTSNRKAG